MNQLQSLLFAASLHTAPIQPAFPQVVYVANLSATDGRDAGNYYSITPMPVVQPVIQPITPIVMPMHEDNGGE
jgi:hypothetical protein